MTIIKAVEQKKKRRCEDCIFDTIRDPCNNFLFFLRKAGLPSCGDGYIYVSGEVTNENKTK